MRRVVLHLVALAFCLLASSAAGQAQTDEDGRWANGVGEPWWFRPNVRYTEEQSAAARALWEQIGAGQGAARDPWAGDYGIDLSVRLHIMRWSPGKGFVFFNVNTCVANVDSLDYGEVVADSPSHVEVLSKLHPGSQVRRKYAKVRWGEQRYLIEEHAVGNFCDYVAGLGGFNGSNSPMDEGVFLSHSDDGEKPTALLPTVPPEYQQYVRRPVDAVITKVGKSYVEVNPENEWWDELVTPVTVSAGSNHGVRRGMKLHILDSDGFDERVEITRAGRGHAFGIVVRSVRKRPGVKVNQWDDGKDDPEQPLTVGWRLTTSLHRQYLRSDDRHAAWEARQPRR